MNAILTRASEVQEATGLSTPGLIFVIVVALAVVLGVSYVYVQRRRRRRGGR
jgi:cobalamin biosynthesis Mg chelatase CobN